MYPTISALTGRAAPHRMSGGGIAWPTSLVEDAAVRPGAAARGAGGNRPRLAHLCGVRRDAGVVPAPDGVADRDPVPARVRVVLLRVLRAQPEPVVAAAAGRVLDGVGGMRAGAAGDRAARAGHVRADLRRVAHPAPELRLPARGRPPQRDRPPSRAPSSRPGRVRGA